MRFPILLLTALFMFGSCNNADDDGAPSDSPVLKLRLQFDQNQERLNNLGQPATIPAGNAAQSPNVFGMAGHFIELVPTEFTPYRSGAIIYEGAEVPASNPNPFGFTSAIDFDRAIVAEDSEVFLEIPLDDIPAGSYNHIRVSLAYQNYEISYNLRDIPNVDDLLDQTGRVASFVGFNTQINSLQIADQSLDVNAPKLQGFWAFETQFSGTLSAFNQVLSGDAPTNATTVVNPFPNSPVPPGSCVVSGSLNRTLDITGDEMEDITLTLSFSVNQSFEWNDTNGNDEWDLYVENPSQSERVVDMGVRGLIGVVE
ncbi:MAG: hypothetical protein AAFY36_14230 [Bacteroidota bacterium]